MTLPITQRNNKQLVSLSYTILLMFNFQQENCDYQLFTIFDLTRRRNRPWRSRGGGQVKARNPGAGLEIASAHFLQSFKNAF